MDFTGPTQRSQPGKRLDLICLEYLTVCPLASATANATAEVLNEFATREIVHVFGPPESVINDNASCFTAKSIVSYMPNNGISVGTVLADAPMSNGRVDQMLGALERSMKRAVHSFGLRTDVERKGRGSGWNIREKHEKDGAG